MKPEEKLSSVGFICQEMVSDPPVLPVCRCREVEQDVVALKAQLVEKQTVQTENHRLKLQLDSMEAQCRVEQRKAGEERSETTQQRS